jgi:aryl-alcohol dehydrogenase-like predicted oxidoreductase
MEYRELGATGMRVSLLGLGTVKFGRNAALPYPVAPTLPSTRDLARLLALGRDLGVNLLDTAPAYGSSEERLGELIAPHRDAWLVSTKVGESFDGYASTYDFTPEHTRASVLRSIERLRTDRIDIVLVHSDGNDLEIIERCGTLDALAQLKREGRIRAYGMSHKTVAGGIAATARCDVVMSTLNESVHAELDVVAAARAQRCGVLVKKPLDSGRAAAHPARLAAALQFVKSIDGVSSIVVGTTDPLHLRANAAALESRAVDR